MGCAMSPARSSPSHFSSSVARWKSSHSRSAGRSGERNGGSVRTTVTVAKHGLRDGCSVAVYGREQTSSSADVATGVPLGTQCARGIKLRCLPQGGVARTFTGWSRAYDHGGFRMTVEPGPVSTVRTRRLKWQGVAGIAAVLSLLAACGSSGNSSSDTTVGGRRDDRGGSRDDGRRRRDDDRGLRRRRGQRRRRGEGGHREEQEGAHEDRRHRAAQDEAGDRQALRLVPVRRQPVQGRG